MVLEGSVQNCCFWVCGTASHNGENVWLEQNCPEVKQRDQKGASSNDLKTSHWPHLLKSPLPLYHLRLRTKSLTHRYLGYISDLNHSTQHSHRRIYWYLFKHCLLKHPSLKVTWHHLFPNIPISVSNDPTTSITQVKVSPIWSEYNRLSCSNKQPSNQWLHKTSFYFASIEFNVALGSYPLNGDFTIPAVLVLWLYNFNSRGLLYSKGRTRKA